MKKILITGGAGFIGSHVVRLFVNKYPEHQIYNLDALTYAGNLENLSDIRYKENYTFIKGDITDEIFKVKAVSIKVSPINSKKYPTSVNRPLYSVLNKSKIKNKYGLETFYWKKSFLKNNFVSN